MTLGLVEREHAVEALRQAALSPTPVKGFTHRFYSYPARSSPVFVRTAIERFSRPGDLVLDPYMGGGTSMVEALAAGRHAVGCDLNSLALFVARAKTQSLSVGEKRAVVEWATETVPALFFHQCPPNLDDVRCNSRTKNLHLPRARAIKKFLELALMSIAGLPSKSQRVARCALLNVSQWALNGRKKQVSLPDFRARLTETCREMLAGVDELAAARLTSERAAKATLIGGSCETLAAREPFRSGRRADLVVTSPPYPGVHILYHRWQVDGRKETPAPYWIANCRDGQGSSYYNFGGRFEKGLDKYFETSLRTLRGIREVMREGAVFVQTIAFSNPSAHLPRYLENMTRASFAPIVSKATGTPEIWRDVPNRMWHATLKGRTSSSFEIVLVHEAR